MLASVLLSRLRSGRTFLSPVTSYAARSALRPALLPVHRGFSAFIVPLDPEKGSPEERIYSTDEVEENVAHFENLELEGVTFPQRPMYERFGPRRRFEDTSMEVIESSPIVRYLTAIGISRKKLIDGFSGKRSSRLSLRFLYLSAPEVQAIFEPRIAYLRALGLVNSDFVRVGDRFLQAFLIDLERNLRPSVVWLRDFVKIPAAKIATVISKYPNVLYHPLENMSERVEFLRTELRQGDDDVVRTILSSPQILGIRVDGNMKEKLQFWGGRLGIDNLVRVVARHPQLLVYNRETCVEPRLRLLGELGLSTDDISRIVFLFPQVIVIKEQKLREKLDFLINGMGYTMRHFVYFPSFLSYSLETRTMPRFAFLRRQFQRGKIPRMYDFWVVLPLKDEAFAARCNSVSDDWSAFRSEFISLSLSPGGSPYSAMATLVDNDPDKLVAHEVIPNSLPMPEGQGMSKRGRPAVVVPPPLPGAQWERKEKSPQK